MFAHGAILVYLIAPRLQPVRRGEGCPDGLKDGTLAPKREGLTAFLSEHLVDGVDIGINFALDDVAQCAVFREMSPHVLGELDFLKSPPEKLPEQARRSIYKRKDFSGMVDNVGAISELPIDRLASTYS